MFLHRMAIELHMTVEEIEARMSTSELLDWIEYWRRIGSDGDTKELADLTTVEQLQAALG